ncbi:hypothetical protein C8F04DRAFT_732595 [Mycena alexandri]|uniref:Uncharacterized protein n=1 Tax=Mycena alexandri TaxID=1745969 RepID=A0AAD6SMY1_9AGAR|nr:hypothetical protein C8F04DRAFT_732595 [Mycena alexandri]
MLFVPVYFLGAIFLSLTQLADSPLVAGLVPRGMGVHNFHTSTRHIPPLPRIIRIEPVITEEATTQATEASVSVTIPTTDFSATATTVGTQGPHWSYRYFFDLSCLAGALLLILVGAVLSRVISTPPQVTVVVRCSCVGPECVRTPATQKVEDLPDTPATPPASPSRAGPSSLATPPGRILPVRRRRLEGPDTTQPRTPRENDALYDWMAEMLATRLRPHLPQRSVHSAASPTPVQSSTDAGDIFGSSSSLALFANSRVRRIPTSPPSTPSPPDLRVLRCLVFKELYNMERQASAASVDMDSEADSDGVDDDSDPGDQTRGEEMGANEEMGAGAVPVATTSATEAGGIAAPDDAPISVLERVRAINQRVGANSRGKARESHSITPARQIGGVVEATEGLENPARVSVLEKVRLLDTVARAKGKGKEVEEVKPDPVVKGAVRAFIEAWVHAAPEREPSDLWLRLRGVQEEWAGEEFFDGVDADMLDI